MVTFIEDHRGASGVEPSCAGLPIAPSTYYAHQARRRDPARPCRRARRDDVLRERIRQGGAETFAVYGGRQVWRELQRRGEPTARCPVARLRGALGLQGAGRGRQFVRTTIADETTTRPPDLVTRQFRAPAPNQR